MSLGTRVRYSRKFLEARKKDMLLMSSVWLMSSRWDRQNLHGLMKYRGINSVDIFVVGVSCSVIRSQRITGRSFPSLLLEWVAI